jgi:8-oxo-dGTP pyrophosphatase MutT (NUDIX family)
MTPEDSEPRIAGRADRIEFVEIVDEYDRVVATVTRAEMRREVLRHRSVFIVVIDRDQRVLVHRRSPAKDIWPGWLDFAVGGVLQPGESYEAGAVREVAEEIGVDSAELAAFDDGAARRYDDDDVRLFGRCFLLHHSGPFTFRDGEISEAWWVPIHELEELTRTERFLPDSTSLLLDRLLSRPG